MGRINMESKESVIQQIMERCKSRFDNIIGKALDGIEQDFRNAYNEGYRCCEKEKASEYQRGYAEAEKNCVKKEAFVEAVNKSYSEGFEDGKHLGNIVAWETAEKVCSYDGEALWSIFGTNSFSEIFSMPYEKVCSLLTDFEEKVSCFDNTYSVGDEVIADNGTACFVITSLDGNDIGGIDGDGNTYAYMPDQICYKTGRHFNVCGLLNDIRIGGNDS